MKAPSIRGCVSLATRFPKSSYKGYKEYFDNQCKQEFGLVAPDSSRRPLPSYRAPTGLWGRVKVALSGATARRERACARLNTFVSSSRDEMEATFQKVALDKFIQLYEKSNRKQQFAMLGNLTFDAWKALPAKVLPPPPLPLTQAMGALQTADMPPPPSP